MNTHCTDCGKKLRMGNRAGGKCEQCKSIPLPVDSELDHYGRVRELKLQEHPCPGCGSTVMGNAGKIYCSKVCKDRYNAGMQYQRKKAKMAEQSSVPQSS